MREQFIGFAVRYGAVRLHQRLLLAGLHEQEGTEARMRFPYPAPLLEGQGRKARQQHRTGGTSAQLGSDFLGEEAHGPRDLLARDSTTDIGLNDHA